VSFEKAFRSLMTTTIRVSTRAGHTNYGAPTWAATASTFAARVVDKPGFVRNDQGEDVAYRSVAWLASTGGSLVVDNRYTLPDGTSPPVVMIERYPDDRGAHHVKLFFGY